ncbi:MAG: Hpt domain-containing protein [Desulfovibrio sp.]|jgi:two-component system sensor histidine kinase/response regulator|nr:Hpt domain-containing protein [Desulfovibrio sp.]
MDEPILDSQEALARVMNKRDLYVRLLGKFIASETGRAETVAGLLSGGDTEGARTQIHTVKGSAANLGAKALAEAALQLETAIRDGGDTASPMADFSSTLTRTLDAMSAFAAQ